VTGAEHASIARVAGRTGRDLAGAGGGRAEIGRGREVAIAGRWLVRIGKGWAGGIGAGRMGRPGAVEADDYFIGDGDVLAGDVAPLGGGEEEVKAVEIAGPGEDGGPLGGRLGVDLAVDEIREGIDATAGAATQEGLGTEVQLELEEEEGGDGDEEKVCEEPEEDLCGDGKAGTHEDLVAAGIDEEIAGGAHGADETGCLGIVAELLAEGGDVDIDGAVEDLVVAVADFLEQLLAGLDAAGGAEEAGEEIELDGGEVEGLVIEGDDAGAEVHAQGAGEELGGIGGGGGAAEGAAADDGAEPGEELAGGECLGEIIIGADLEADDAVGFIATGSEHEDGDIAGFANLLEDLEAIDAWEHEVEDDGLPGLGSAVDALGTGVDGGDIVAERLKVCGDEAAELAIIIDEEQAGAGGVCGAHGGRVAKGEGGMRKVLHLLNNSPGGRG